MFVRDFYQAVDVSAGGWVAVPFGGITDGQALLNESGVDCEISFDAGVTVYPLKATGATSQLVFDGHSRASVSVRRATGTGACSVQVFAWSQP